VPSAITSSSTNPVPSRKLWRSHSSGLRQTATAIWRRESLGISILSMVHGSIPMSSTDNASLGAWPTMQWRAVRILTELLKIISQTLKSLETSRSHPIAGLLKRGPPLDAEAPRP
jgi:hypothetical protein